MQAKKNIQKRNLKENKKRIESFKNPTGVKQYRKLKESFIYLIYIGVFVTMILYQTNNTSSQKAGWPVKRVLTT